MPQIFKSKILNIKDLTPNTKEFTISVPEDFEFIPGQFVMLEQEIEGKIKENAYSIASNVKDNSIDLCIKKPTESLFVSKLFGLKVGDEIETSGPHGVFSLKKYSKDKNYVFLSTGTGIAPFKTMIEFLIKSKHKGKIILINGSRLEKDSLYAEEFGKFEKENSNFKFYKVLSRTLDENYEYRGHVQDFIEENVDDKENYEYYVCGLKQMVEDVKNKLIEFGISGDRIFFEKY